MKTPADRYYKPSNDWVARLILLIQESPSETGKDFSQWFCWEFEDNVSGEHNHIHNDDLIKALKGML